MPPGTLIEPDAEVIEFDDIAYENPEYKVFTFRFFENAPNDLCNETIQNWLNTGWNLYHEIVCPPFVMLFFSREKEVE